MEGWQELPGSIETAQISEPAYTIRQISNFKRNARFKKASHCVKQIYLNFSFTVQKANKRPVLGLIDTGSDLNIITVGYLEVYLPNWRKMPDAVNTKVQNIRSVTGEEIPQLGVKRLWIYIKNNYAPFEFVILPDSLPNKCIFGRDLFTHFSVSLTFNRHQNVRAGGICNDHSFTLTGDKKPVPLLHMAIPGIYQMFTNKINLKAQTTSKVMFMMGVNPFLTPDSVCLVTASDNFNYDALTWVDTKCRPGFTEDGKTLCFAVIVNDGETDVFFHHLLAHMEVVSRHAEYIQIVTAENETQLTGEQSLVTQSVAPQPTDKLPLSDKVTNSKNNSVLSAVVNMGPNSKLNTRYAKNLCSKRSLKNCAVSFHSAKQPRSSVYQCNEIRVHNGQSDEEFFKTAEELLDEEIMPSIQLPPARQPTVEEVFSMEPEDEWARPHLEEIFLHNNRNVIGCHNLDAGPVRYLGKIKLRIKPGMKLPRHTKVYNISDADQQHLDDILGFMNKYKFIADTYQDDEESPSLPWGAPCYLILRKANPKIKENSGLPGFSRLICDFSQGLNKILEPTPALVKGIEPVLESLKGGYFFSLLDLKQSYYGLLLDESSYKYTQCVAPPGRSFVWQRMPMGISSAPASLLEKVNQILNFVPKRDDAGNIMFHPGENPQDPGARAILLPNKIGNVVNFYDDLLVYTPKSKKPESDENEESIKEHFQAVRKLADRMSLFQLKVTFHKCVWCRRYVDFLGWHVRDDVITADKKRIAKVQNFEFPQTRKQMLGFLGLVNTIKRVSPLPACEELALLTELASTRMKYDYTDKHTAAFEKVKQILTQGPLYCHMVDPAADKIIFVDASGLAYGSVLLSRLGESDLPVFSSHISQNDKDDLNQVIRYWGLKLYIGEKYSSMADSFYSSILFLAKYHNLSVKFDSVAQLREALLLYTKRSIIGAQVKEQHCNNLHSVFQDFLYNRIGSYQAVVSDTDVILHLMASFLGRGLNIYRADMKSEELPLYDVLPEGSSTSTAEAFNLGFYPEQTGNVGHFVPLLCFKSWEFNPSLLNSKYCVNFYDSKIIPLEHRNRSILELEATSLLYALKKYKSYITNCNTYVITDNRSLFYMFSQAVVQSHAKISRYNMKLQSDFPHVKILWCSTEVNLADLFTRFGLQTEFESKIKFKHCKVENLPNIPSGTVLSWHDMAEITNKHPKALKVLLDYSQTYGTKHKGKLNKIRQLYQEDDSEMETNRRQLQNECTDALLSSGLTARDTSRLAAEEDGCHMDGSSGVGPAAYIRALTVSTEQANFLTKPILALQERLSLPKVREAQHTQLQALYTDLLNAPNNVINLPTHSFSVIQNVIYVTKHKQQTAKLLVIPESLEPIVLSYVHLLHGHTSAAQMYQELKASYFFIAGKIYQKASLFCQSCTSCAINSRDTRLVALQGFLINPATRPYQYVVADLAENLTKFLSYYRHILVIKCLSTGHTMCFPLKSKTADSVCFHMLHGVYQAFGPIERLYTDNGKVFRKHEVLALFAALRIKVETTVALDSKSRGFVERAIRSLKTLIKKMLYADIRREPNVIDILPFLASVCMNHSYNTRVGSTPHNLVFGRNFSGENLFTNQHSLPLLHPELQRADGRVMQLKNIIDYENRNVQKYIAKAQERSKKAVRNPVQKSLPVGSLVYILDQSTEPAGVSMALKPYYEKSVYCVLKEYKTHVAVMRLADTSVLTRSKNSVKLIKEYPRFNEIPTSIQNILKKMVTNLTQEDLELITSIDGFESFRLDPTDLPNDLYEGEPDYADTDSPWPMDAETSQTEQEESEDASSSEEEEAETPTADIGRRYPRRANRQVKFANLKF